MTNITSFSSNERIRQAILAVNQAWQHAAQTKATLPTSLLTRSVAILKALQKYTTNDDVKVSLQQAQQHIETYLSNQNTHRLSTPPTAQQVPWFNRRFPFPASQADLALDASWKKQIKAQRNDPYQRLGLALSKIPYRLAYQEAILALRAIVRANTSDQAQALALLYWLAASASFLESQDSTPSGEQIIAALNGETLQTLPMPYQQLGTKHLRLLNKTDQKNLELLFGPVKQHTTLKALQSSAWSQYQTRLQQLKH